MCGYRSQHRTGPCSVLFASRLFYSTVNSGPDERKHQSSASLVFVRGIHRWPNSPHKGPVTRKMLSFEDVIMIIWPTWWPSPWTYMCQVQAAQWTETCFHIPMSPPYIYIYNMIYTYQILCALRFSIDFKAAAMFRKESYLNIHHNHLSW